MEQKHLTLVRRASAKGLYTSDSNDNAI